MRRQVSNSESDTLSATPTSKQSGLLYGDQNQDKGGEVRFSFELTRLEHLEDTYTLDMRRLKGDLKSYEFLHRLLTE